MKRIVGYLIPTAAVAFFIYLGIVAVQRMFFDAPGDALIPIMFGVLIIMGSAIFQQVSKPVMLVTPEEQRSNNYQRAELN